MSEAKRAARVLVVDDRPEMAEMIADDLSDRGYEGISVSSGAEALRRLGVERVDVLVTDLNMPDMDGLALVRASRELDPSRPVIVMTAFHTLESAIDANEGGVLHYVLKPFRLGMLARLVGEAIRER